MDHQSSGINFAVIGHQENWNKVCSFVNTLRIAGGNHAYDLESIRPIYGYIPPRKLFDIEVFSPVSGLTKGIYIETFISPDELDAKHLISNLKKVKDACKYATEQGCAIASLGGFTSIVLETAGEHKINTGRTFFTTGNSLTAAFIVNGIETLCKENQIELQRSSILIIGSTGDIGSACVHYFTGSVQSILLCARREKELKKQKENLIQKGQEASYSTDLNMLLPKSDLVISVASSLIHNADFSLLPSHAIVSDAGYPKNLSEISSSLKNKIVVAGGMGKIKSGYTFKPDHKKLLYDTHDEDIVHGCLAESIVLAMENKPMAYSAGRGHITKEKMNEILKLSIKHGIEPYLHYTNKPLYNDTK